MVLRAGDYALRKLDRQACLGPTLPRFEPRSPHRLLIARAVGPSTTAGLRAHEDKRSRGGIWMRPIRGLRRACGARP
jgi:hypothetical protein